MLGSSSWGLVSNFLLLYQSCEWTERFFDLQTRRSLVSLQEDQCAR